MQRETFLAPKRYPVRFWLLIALAIQMPSFVNFDASGRTHDIGLFNATSISVILLSLLSAALLLMMAVLNRQKLFQRSVTWDMPVWLSLLGIYTVASVLSPPGHLTPAKATDLPVSLYRLFDWVLFFVVFLSIYTREPSERITSFVRRTIGYVCWTQILMIWVLFCVMPFRVYTVTDEPDSSHARFGGGVTNPVYLAVMAGIGFFYALFFWRGKRRIAACALAFVTLMATYARSAQLLFFITLFVYLLVFSKRVMYRWAGILAIAAVLTVGLAFSGRILEYLERGQGLRNVVTLSERTDVWKASLTAFADRPWIGYGFVVGVKNAIKDHWNATNWVPPYAHNEYIQALATGGVFAGLLDVYLHLHVLWIGIRDAKKDPEHTFFMLAYVQIFGMSFLTVTVSAAKDTIGTVFVLLFFGIVARARVGRPALARRRVQAVPDSLEGAMAPASARWRTPTSVLPS